MEGVWKFNPFYWMALGRLDRANQNQQSLSLSGDSVFSGRKLSLNPLRWSNRVVRVFFASLLVILTPIYFFSGIQPVSSIEAASYPTLDIPSIGLSTPVAPLEMTDRQLIAPATIAGSYSQSENKLFIIGHSSTVFQELAETQLHQHFYYNNDEYTITNIETLEKSDVDMNNILAPANEGTIVIMTCAGTPLPDQDATHRLIVTAERSHAKSQTYVRSSARQTQSQIPSIPNFTKVSE